MTKLVCISDTHNDHWDLNVPNGDILIHAGDIGLHRDFVEVTDFNKWLGMLPHKFKLICAGNHDFFVEKNPNLAQRLITNGWLLIDQEIVLEGLKFYLSPYSPWFYDWAFNLQRGEELKREWAKIPDDTDILVTHGPPFGILDMNMRGKHVGCEDLLARVKEISPKVHVFGHLHESAGMSKIGETIFINASQCNLYNDLIGDKVITIDL